MYPASITDKHKAPQALIWGCHKQPAAPAMQCFTNRCGRHFSIQSDPFFFFFFVGTTLRMSLFSGFVVQIVHPVALSVTRTINARSPCVYINTRLLYSQDCLWLWAIHRLEKVNVCSNINIHILLECTARKFPCNKQKVLN